MSHETQFFEDAGTLYRYFREKKRGGLTLPYVNLPEYPGMVRGMSIVFDFALPKWELDIQWISFGLDYTGENLLENYTYEFSHVDVLLTYLYDMYGIEVTDIPVSYRINPSEFPNPLGSETEKQLYQQGWQDFQEDFATRQFLDPAEKLVYHTHDL